MPRTIITVPTYNERENITLLLDAVLDLKVEGLEVLVIDDSSPDGTADAVRAVAARRPGAHLLLRTTERGRGTAGIAGLRKALGMGADFVFEMDADFSHQPRYIPPMLEILTSGGAELVLGSRFIPGGKDADRPFVRRIISELARRYTRGLLGLPVLDVTSGFRGFSRRLLEAVELATFVSTGPSIVQELMFRAHVRGFRMAEIPIEFVDRTRGQSTLTFKILAQSLLFVPRLRLRGW